MKMEYRFKEIREENELTQKEVAELLGITRSMYSNIEAELSNIKLSYLLTFCNQFHCTLDYVCKLSDENDFEEILPIKKIDKQEMARRLTILEHDQKIRAMDVASFLGILKSTYSGYKNKELNNLMQSLMLKQLAKKYQYSMDYLIGRTNQKYLKVKER